jgi:D-cysteine desulfhydrase
VLYDQPVTPFVRKNLGGFLHAGARLHYSGGTPAAFAAAGALYARTFQEDMDPYFIMVGGTSRLGAIGHVNAALELSDQVANGLIPEPDVVFVPLGTCGTATGMIVGLKLAGLRTRVVAVRVADPFPANATMVRLIAQDVANFLHASDPTIPRLEITTGDFDVLPEYFGPGYGHPTAPGEAAVRAASPRLVLETTYTGKTLAACLDHCRRASAQSNVLFWNTFSSAPVPAPDSWERLPENLQRRLLAPS